MHFQTLKESDSEVTDSDCEIDSVEGGGEDEYSSEEDEESRQSTGESRGGGERVENERTEDREWRHKAARLFVPTY